MRWAAVLTYFLATSMGHLVVTEWLLRPRVNAWWGEYAFKDAVPVVLVVGGLALLAWVMRTAWRDPHGRWATGRYWLLWLACVAMVDRFLTYSIYEYAHYPQYALLAWLVARALDPACSGAHRVRILFWTALLGVVDELMQYLWITPSYGNYLDFNDFLVNLLGAVAGEMLYSGRRTSAALRATRSGHAVEWCTVALLGLAIAGGVATQRLQVSPPSGLAVAPGGWSSGTDGVTRWYLQRASGWYASRQISPHRGAYWVLPPGLGTALILLVGLTFACRRRRADVAGLMAPVPGTGPSA